jgi:hypothetical protein
MISNDESSVSPLIPDVPKSPTIVTMRFLADSLDITHSYSEKVIGKEFYRLLYLR